MKNRLFEISISLILILIFLIIPASADLPVGHKQVICFDCHGAGGRFGFGSETDDDECGSCHIYTTKDAQESMHNPMTCKACHRVTDNKAFHTLHINNSCSRCHGTNGNAVPESTIDQCGGCHGGKLHDIHTEKLDQICVTCHSKRPRNTPQNIIDNSPANQIYAKVVDYQKYTLLELIKSLFGWS